MYCKHCGKLLPDDAKTCPRCGKPIDRGSSAASTLRIVLLTLACVGLAAAIIWSIYSAVSSENSSGNTNASTNTSATDSTDATEEATYTSYTGTEEEVLAAAQNIVASMDGAEMTNELFQAFYWSDVYDFFNTYYYYLSYYMDYTEPLDEQLYSEDMTWQEYFIESAFTTWQTFQAVALEAEADGYEISADSQAEIDNMEATLLEQAESYGYETALELLQADMGPGVTLESYREYLQLYYLANEYYMQMYNALSFTEEEISDYYTENADTILDSYSVDTDSGRYVDARHILIMPEGGTTDDDGNTTYSDEEWAAALEEAERILAEWLAGDATEDSFAELANEYSDDTGSNTNGGLYSQIAEGDMVEAFEDWCFDESRVYGDYGIVETSYGYHIMYFVSSEEIWHYYSRNLLISEAASEQLTAWIDAHPMETFIENVCLGQGTSLYSEEVSE